MKKILINMVMVCAVSLISFIIDSSQEERSVEFIDKDGRAGTIRGLFVNDDVRKLSFISETEIGSYEENYLYDEGLVSVVVKETTFNRPKFWNESVARANNDDEWFDPSKSTTSTMTHYFSQGKFEYTEDEAGARSYPVNKRLRKAGEIYLTKADEYLQALNQ